MDVHLKESPGSKGCHYRCWGFSFGGRLAPGCQEDLLILKASFYSSFQDGIKSDVGNSVLFVFYCTVHVAASQQFTQGLNWKLESSSIYFFQLLIFYLPYINKWALSVEICHTHCIITYASSVVSCNRRVIDCKAQIISDLMFNFTKRWRWRQTCIHLWWFLLHRNIAPKINIRAN